MTIAFMLIHITFNSINETVTKIVIIKNIIIYDIVSTQQRLLIITNVYSIILKKNDIVHVSKLKWMFIDTILNAKIESFKIYFVNPQNRKVINKKFNKFHEQNKLRWIIEIILYDFSIFIVWRIIHISKKSICKNRVIINIRDFNKIIVSNDYSMFL